MNPAAVTSKNWFVRVGVPVTLAGLLVVSLAVAQGPPGKAATPATVANTPATKGRIRVLSGTIATTQRNPAQLKARADALRASDHDHFVIQFGAPLTDAQRAQIAQQGIELQDYVDDNAFVARGAKALDGDRLAGLGLVRDVLPMDATFKMHPRIAQEQFPSWSQVTAAQQRVDGTPVTDPDPLRPENAIVAVYAQFQKDVPLEPVAVAIALRHGATVVSRVPAINTLVLELPAGNVKLLAGEDEIQWIEPPLPPMAELNAENRVRTGANIVQIAPYNLNGAGVNVLIYDGGKVRSTHVDFQGRCTIGPTDTSSTSDHSTHVAGTVGGAGVAVAANKGMAPAVNLISYGFEQPGGLTAGFLYTDPGDLQADYTAAITTFNAHISNNSIGTNTAPNNFDCNWEGDYGLTSQLIDKIVRGTAGVANGQPFRVVWANGNERQVTRCGSTYHTTAPPACAKNHIAVGALNSNDDSITSFTSWGPSDDGRMKPDISAPGCQVGGDNGVTSCSSSSDTAYAVKCGTSMASPTVCGLSSLLLQDFRAQYPARPDFRNSTLKILLAHTAVDLGNAGPDNQFGYGSVRIQAAVDFMRTGNFLEADVSQGGSYNVLVVVPPASPEFKATLAWDDFPAAAAAVGTIVNDLDLVVTDANNNRVYPWTLSLANPGNPAVQTQENHLDNIEQVRVASPIAGVWRVSVVGFNVPQGPQPFSLCASPQLVNCSRTGVIGLNKPIYNCASQVEIRVVDCDLNADSGAVETVNVTINSTSEPGGETVTLTETGNETADFRGTINLSTHNSPGVLQVAHGNTITATYVDADDGQGGFNIVRTSNAAIDCAGPVISNVQVINIAPHSATVTFTTDESANSVVQYGSACGSLSSSQPGSGQVTSHSINLTGLTDNATFYFAVQATDAAGNQTTNNNGGVCFSFTTPEVPDYFTEQFTTDNDLDNRQILWAPNGSVDYYGACSVNIGLLPTDPAGGTPVTLANDAFATVTLTGGHTVKLYGISYGTVFIGSNGYLTFTAGDTDATETLADHFNRPRVSALFDDLNPAQAGAVSYKEMSDRLAVTWQNVTVNNAANSNTFQIVMYYDGRIELNYLSLADTSGLAGLSAGAGLSPDFFETDLSVFPSCGPRPPSASGASLSVGQSTTVNINLPGSDDGLPVPPTLDFSVLSLPTGQLKDTGNNHVIVPGDLPYTLVGQGSQVAYTAPPGTGSDSFSFKCNDNGTPPDGGDSNVANIAVTVVPILSLPFVETFPATSFDNQKWATVSNATIDTVGTGEPSAPNSARFNGDPAGGDSIVTHIINLGSESAVRLSYWYEQRGGGESPDAGDDLFVEYLDANNAWQLLAQHLGSGPDQTAYVNNSLLLPAAALHAGFRLRIRNTATTGAFDDWFVDDVSLTVANAPTANDAAYTVNVNTAMTASMPASDPNGDPLTWTILSLPAHGALKDPNGGVILSAPYSLTINDPTVLYKGAFNYNGPDSFTFKASDGTYDSNVATVNMTVGGAQPVITFNLNTNPGWTTTGQWAFGQPTGAGSHNLDPAGGFTGTNVYGYNLSGDYPNNMGVTEYLTTAALNCSGITGVQLKFRRWLGIESSSFDHATIDVSTNGTTWTNVFNHNTAAISENAWSLQTYSLPTADSQPTVYLRWGMGPTDGSVTYPGWNIDDIEIWGLVPQSCPPVTPGDTNFDGDFNGLDVQVESASLADPFTVTTAQMCASDVNQDNQLNALDSAALVQLLLTAP